MLVERISQNLQLSHEYLVKLGRSASHKYKTYSIPKRSGGSRTIHHPARPLKAVQRWLLHAVLARWPISPHAHAYVTGRGILSNARVHVQSNYLLRMDLADFFPSLTGGDIREFWRRNPELVDDWTEFDRDWFCSIVLLRGQLTIGAPTSPSLSNALFRDVDRELVAVCEEQAVSYSRYADDLYFSCAEQGVLPGLEQTVTRIIDHAQLPRSIAVNVAKTHHSSRQGRRVVTGLILTSDGRISIGRQRKRWIRSLVHRYEELDGDKKRELAGLLSFIHAVEPNYLNNLVLKYGPERITAAMEME